MGWGGVGGDETQARVCFLSVALHLIAKEVGRWGRVVEGFVLLISSLSSQTTGNVLIFRSLPPTNGTVVLQRTRVC